MDGTSGREERRCPIPPGSIRLLRAGAPHGDDKAAEDAWNWGATYKGGTYGGAADLSGGTWTPADVNDALFGGCVSCNRLSGTSRIVAYADCIRITICYTEGPLLGGGGAARSQERIALLGVKGISPTPEEAFHYCTTRQENLISRVCREMQPG